MVCVPIRAPITQRTLARQRMREHMYTLSCAAFILHEKRRGSTDTEQNGRLIAHSCPSETGVRRRRFISFKCLSTVRRRLRVTLLYTAADIGNSSGTSSSLTDDGRTEEPKGG